MTDYIYYLHFKEPQPPETIEKITAVCFGHRQVYASSYELASNLSFSKMKHLLKSLSPMPEHYLGLLKNAYNAYEES